MTTIQTYIDTNTYTYQGLFAGSMHAWDVLPQLESYITSLFANGTVVGNYNGQKDVYIGEGTIVHEGVRIEGPAIIGDNCVIAHAAYIRGGCLFGNNVRIGHGAEIKHSVFFNGAVAAHLNYVGDSIIGNNVNISGGAMLANFRLDKQEIIVKHEAGEHATGLQKFGAVIGDGANVGANAVLNPGTLLGKGVIVYPLQSVRGVHHANAIIK